MVDLCTLELSSLHFPASKIAATALWYCLDCPKAACLVSGYSIEDLQDCFNWMAAFAITVKELGPAHMKFFEGISHDDLHNIQTHSVDLTVLVSKIYIDLLRFN